MLDTLPSRTALATAFLRAVHVRLDDPPPVFDDPIAYQLLPSNLRRFIGRRAALPPVFAVPFRLADPAGLAMRAQIVVRARYAEDCLAAARPDGLGRYVVLGAGLDTFALRQRQPAIPVVEVDHPATQAWKQRLLLQRGIASPPELSFVPVDFEKTRLEDAWVDSAQPDFLSWLGTTYYLSRAGIRSTLETLAERTTSGSQLVLDYWTERPGRPFSPLLLGMRIAVASQGEPMRSFFGRGEIETLAQEAGWTVVENLWPAEQIRRYLAYRRDGLRVPVFANLLRLRKG
ncbi:MAG: SAM-dependent methyltransferase [Pseudomonadota bacterium]